MSQARRAFAKTGNAETIRLPRRWRLAAVLLAITAAALALYVKAGLALAEADALLELWILTLATILMLAACTGSRLPGVKEAAAGGAVAVFVTMHILIL